MANSGAAFQHRPSGFKYCAFYLMTLCWALRRKHKSENENLYIWETHSLIGKQNDTLDNKIVNKTIQTFMMYDFTNVFVGGDIKLLVDFWIEPPPVEHGTAACTFSSVSWKGPMTNYCLQENLGKPRKPNCHQGQTVPYTYPEKGLVSIYIVY